MVKKKSPLQRKLAFIKAFHADVAKFIDEPEIEGAYKSSYGMDIPYRRPYVIQQVWMLNRDTNYMVEVCQFYKTAEVIIHTWDDRHHTFIPGEMFSVINPQYLETLHHLSSGKGHVLLQHKLVHPIPVSSKVKDLLESTNPEELLLDIPSFV